MQVKTFISTSAHQEFLALIKTSLEGLPVEESEELIQELLKEHEELEQIYIRYSGLFAELHRLIAEYQAKKIQVRKKLRQIQLKNKQDSSED